MQSNNNKEIKVIKVVESNNNNNNNDNKLQGLESDKSIPDCSACSDCNKCNCTKDCASGNTKDNISQTHNNASKNPFKRIFDNLINMFGVGAVKTNKANKNDTDNKSNKEINKQKTCDNNDCISENKNDNISENSESTKIQVSTIKPVEKQMFIIEFKEIKNAKYKNGGKFKVTPKWIVVHYTAVIGASAKSCATSYAKTTRAVSTHFFCDSNDIYRCVDEKHIAWHVGNGTVQQPYKDKKLSLQELVEYGDKPNWRFKLAAENHLKWIDNGEDFKGNCAAFGVDLCVLKKNKNSTSVTDDDWYFNDDAVKNAEKCVAYLCHKYNIDLDHVIRHADATGKPCLRPMVSLSGDKDKTKNDNLWLDFKRNVQFILDNYNFD